MKICLSALGWPSLRATQCAGSHLHSLPRSAGAEIACASTILWDLHHTVLD